jgi:hypothetical protein
MSNNEDMEVDTDSGHGLRGTHKNSEGHAARGNKGSSRGVNENDREHLQQEQDKKQGHHSKHSNEVHDRWKEVGARANGGRSKANYNQTDNRDSNEVRDHWTKVGSRANGGYQSNDNKNGNRDSNGESNGDRACLNDNRDECKNTKYTDVVMSAYTCKTGFVEVCFVCGSGKGFNIARALKEFVSAAPRQDMEFKILPVHGSGNNICNAKDVAGSREGIESHY